ncbi:MAG: hypothetical protein CSA29_02620 [Desulfobacterales bacterium]|nr:MAG: hypothetical protein CSA29_02620 [Desulfobacterales bacterium]
MNIAEKILNHALSMGIVVLGMLSPAMGRFFGKCLGRIWFGLDKKHRSIALDGLSHAFASEMGNHERWLMARRVFENMATILFEHAWFHRMDPKQYWRTFEIKGIHNFWAAHAKGKGVLCFSGHLGNWEVATALCSIIDVPFSIVYKTISSPVLDRYIKSKRSATGGTLIPKHNAMNSLFECLERGEAVGLVVDQNSINRKHSVFVDFFGRKASANTGLALIAHRTKAPVVPIFIYRKNGRLCLDILPEMAMVRTGDRVHDIQVNTQAIHSLIETYIRKYPDQWLWLHNRWKTRPIDEG